MQKKLKMLFKLPDIFDREHIHSVTILFQLWILQCGWKVCYDVDLWLTVLS